MSYDEVVFQLEKYKKIFEEIKEISKNYKNELDSLKSITKKKNDIKIQNKNIIRNVERKYLKSEILTRQYKKLLNMKKKKAQGIEKFLNCISSDEVRKIIEDYYINCLSVDEIVKTHYISKSGFYQKKRKGLLEIAHKIK